jgi:hypothetical protein
MNISMKRWSNDEGSREVREKTEIRFSPSILRSEYPPADYMNTL